MKTLRILSILMLLALCAPLCAQVDVYISDASGTATNLRNRAGGGAVLFSVPQSASAGMTVYRASGGWLCIDPESFYIMDAQETGCQDLLRRIRQTSCELWIHHSVICVDTRNYGGQTIQLHQQPSAGSTVVYQFTDEQRFRVLDFNADGWVRVRSFDRKHEGWVLQEWLCGNPVTTCV